MVDTVNLKKPGEFMYRLVKKIKKIFCIDSMEFLVIKFIEKNPEEELGRILTLLRRF